MGTELLEQYDEQRERVRVAEEAEAKAKAVYDKAKDARKAAEAELHLLRSRLERAISGAGSGGGEDPSDAQDDSALSAPKPVEPTTPPPPDGIRQSLWELLLTIPPDGDVDMDVLRERFDLSDGAISSRVSKAKKRKYVESAGWGRYKLTEKGKELVERRGLRLLEVDE